MLLVGLVALLAAVALGAYAALGTTRVAAVAGGSPVAVDSAMSDTASSDPAELPKLLRRAGGLLGLFSGMKHGFLPSVAFAALGAVIGLALPDVLVRNLGEKRQQLIRLGLPDAMDVLTVCVEAGLGFDAALGRVARNLEGPVAQECARVLQEMQFGKSRSDAMRALAERTDVPEVRSFVAAVVQSGELGISIGDVLREQARELRIKRRQRAQEKAQKLQVKLLVPMISCLLPAMFVVVLGPAVIQLIGFFGSVNK